MHERAVFVRVWYGAGQKASKLGIMMHEGWGAGGALHEQQRRRWRVRHGRGAGASEKGAGKFFFLQGSLGVAHIAGGSQPRRRSRPAFHSKAGTRLRPGAAAAHEAVAAGAGISCARLKRASAAACSAASDAASASATACKTGGERRDERGM